VIPGFYGQGPDGRVKTFSRGGSDITGAIAARACEADVYENWTDVSGVLLADPKIVAGARPVAEITYHELRALSYMGAGVLHEAAVFPVQERGIPIHIKNTNRPEDPGTWIRAGRRETGEALSGIAGVADCEVFFLFKSRLKEDPGFLLRTLEVFARRGIGIEHLPLGVDHLSVVIRKKALGEDLSGPDSLKASMEILEELTDLGAEEVGFDGDLSLIALAGPEMARKPELASRAAQALAAAGVGLKFWDAGASPELIILGVGGQNREKAIQALYRSLA
jgi:aspartate kinase